MQIYKVFVNNYFILFLDSINNIEKYILNQNESTYKVLDENDDLISILKDGNYYLDSNLILLCQNPMQSFNEFKSNFNFVKAAGGVVENNNSELLMIYKNKTWDLPKGKVEYKESSEVAAIREVEEETNLNKLSILSDSFSTYHIYRELSNSTIVYLKETKWFLMHTGSKSDLIMPQINEGITKVKWMSFKQAEDLKTYTSIKFLLRYFRIY